MYLAFLYASKSSMQMYSYTRYVRYACVYVHYMTKYLSFLACKHYIVHILRYPKPRKQRHADVALALLRGGSAACVASSCHGRYWSALWLGAMAAHLWILLVDWCWLMLIDWSICLVGLTFTIDLTLFCMCWFMWACRSRHHYNESSTGLVCTWRHCKAVPCLYCFGLRDVNKKWKKVSKWTRKILPFVKCNVMAFVLIMVYVVMALWQDSAMTSGNRKQHSWENSWMNTPRTGLCLSPFANDNDSSSQSSSMRRSSWFGAGILQHISHTRYEMVWDDEMSHHAAICLLVILAWIIMTESDCCCCHSRMLTSKWICR